jgi:proteic killer suppression protein
MGVLMSGVLDLGTLIRVLLKKNMIKIFRDRYAANLFGDGLIPLFANIELIVPRKSLYLHRAWDLNYLRVPPGNRLGSLRGERKGQYSIRVNDQRRICFRCRISNAYDVEILDYH